MNFKGQNKAWKVGDSSFLLSKNRKKTLAKKLLGLGSLSYKLGITGRSTKLTFQKIIMAKKVFVKKYCFYLYPLQCHENNADGSNLYTMYVLNSALLCHIGVKVFLKSHFFALLPIHTMSFKHEYMFENISCKTVHAKL